MCVKCMGWSEKSLGLQSLHISLRCSEERCDLTWTASVGHCSTLYQRRAASWRLFASCDQSWRPLCSVEASSASLAPLSKHMIYYILYIITYFNYTPIFVRFVLIFPKVYMDIIFVSLRLTKIKI